MDIYKLINHPLLLVYSKIIKPNNQILDLGCIGLKHFKKCKELNMISTHFGVDYANPSEEIPEDFVFKSADLNKEPIPFENDTFDVVFAQHIIEHLNDPINFVSESIRVCKPGGYIYIEAPSERTLMLQSMSFNFEQFRSISFYDDPTHQLRPWTAQAFYRLSKYLSVNIYKTGYIEAKWLKFFTPFILPILRLIKHDALYEGIIWAAYGWSTYIIIQKPLELKGKPKFNYFYPQSRL